MGEIKVVFNPDNRGELKVGNVTFRSFYDCRLTEDDLNRARLELGETEEKKADSLLKLKDTLKRDKDFDYRLDEEYLLRFLRYRKYDLKKTYHAIRKFYTFRMERSNLFVIPSNLDFFLSRDILKCLPYRNEEGSFIYWIDTRQWNLDEMTFNDIMITVHAYCDVVSMNPGNQINGGTSIWDVGGITVSHLYQYCNPSVIKNFAQSLLSNYPWRIRQLIAVNCNPILRGVYYAMRYLLSKKITDRVILLGSDTSELHQYINPRLLPKEYGGCIETSECRISQYIKDNLPCIKYERSFGSNKKA